MTCARRGLAGPHVCISSRPDGQAWPMSAAVHSCWDAAMAAQSTGPAKKGRARRACSADHRGSIRPRGYLGPILTRTVVNRFDDRAGLLGRRGGAPRLYAVPQDPARAKRRQRRRARTARNGNAADESRVLRDRGALIEALWELKLLAPLDVLGTARIAMKNPPIMIRPFFRTGAASAIRKVSSTIWSFDRVFSQI